MKKVLLVSPHFPPVNAPDMQRIRLALPHLRACGWEPVVLCLVPEHVESAVIEPLLESTYPADIRVVRVRGIPPRVTRRLGFGGLWLRCGRALRKAGERLLAAERFDLVFFSTTQFDAFALGPLWRQRFGVPYVLDYQDPWVNGHYRRTGMRPPGGRLKFAFAQWRARRQEPDVLRQAGGIVAVSDAYGPNLAQEYPWFEANRVRLLPFGAAAEDIATARRHRPARPLIDFNDGLSHHVYTGRGGADMAVSLGILFRAFRSFLDTHPQEAGRIRFHFIGTDYAPPPLGREWVMPVARAEGVAEYVREHCRRVPYFDALHYLVNAQALVAVGSNDPSYSASKIFPYILAGRPMAVIFDSRSPVLSFVAQTGSGLCFPFSEAQDTAPLERDIREQWFVGGGMARVHPLDPEAFRPFTANAMTRGLVDCFESALAAPSPRPL